MAEETFIWFAGVDWGSEKHIRHWPYRATRMRRMRNGTAMAVEVEVHPDLRVQRILEQLREAEIIPAVDRSRPVFNERLIIVMNELALDLTYDQVSTHRDLVDGGDKIDRAWAQAGVLPETPKDLRNASRELFGSEDTAKRSLRKSKHDAMYRAPEHSVWAAPTLLYRRPGQRGRPARARIAPWVTDPKAALEALIGPIAELLPDTDHVAAASGVLPALPSDTDHSSKAVAEHGRCAGLGNSMVVTAHTEVIAP